MGSWRAMKILGRTAGWYKDNTIVPCTLTTSKMKHNVVTKHETGTTVRRTMKQISTLPALASRLHMPLLKTLVTGPSVRAFHLHLQHA